VFSVAGRNRTVEWGGVGREVVRPSSWEACGIDFQLLDAIGVKISRSELLDSAA